MCMRGSVACSSAMSAAAAAMSAASAMSALGPDAASGDVTAISCDSASISSPLSAGDGSAWDPNPASEAE